MSYHIEAYLDQGNPTIKIWDSEKQALHLNWSYRASEADHNDKLQKEVHQLFRQLLLLTLKQDVKNVRVFRLASTDHP